MAGTFRGR